MKNFIFVFVFLTLISCGKSGESKTTTGQAAAVYTLFTVTTGQGAKIFLSSGVVKENFYTEDEFFKHVGTQTIYWVDADTFALDDVALFSHVENNFQSVGTCEWTLNYNSCDSALHENWREFVFADNRIDTNIYFWENF